MQISQASIDTFAPPVKAYPEADESREDWQYRNREDWLKRGGFSSALSYLRRALMMLWVDYHRTASAIASLERLRSRIMPLKDIYQLSSSQVSRSSFDMEYGLASLLTADSASIEAFLSEAKVYETSQEYGFYTGFVGVIKGLLTGDKQMIEQQRKGLEKSNPEKFYYWPSKAVIFACLDGDCKTLASNVAQIEKKFTGYAKKMEALDAVGNVDLRKLDLHFFCPYPDFAFYAMAFRTCGLLMKKDSFWMPKALVEACGQQLARLQTK
ncbi:MAG TPA: hypothetical protein VFZ59_16950 [Verrucomicrobiae bacterium]|nr:hypothetical protein [Verrucomicrobiae bacterium]